MGIPEILNLLGSLGMFLVGMKTMSDALMDLAGNKMRRIMAGLTSNRFSAALTGLFVTGLIQSSSATTLMVVSFVNAGLLRLTEAIGVIMGANIGTTMTAWLVAVLGFKVSMIDVSLPLMIVGFVLTMRENERTSSLGRFVIGFALLFIGLEFMKEAVPDLESNPALFEFIEKLSGYGFWSLLLFAFLGTVLTLVLQSSSATMAITLIALSQGWLPFESGCAIVLGENIGTTITANLAALVSGTSARRAAFAHLLFNIIGVVWVLALFDPFVGLVSNLSISLQGASPLTNPEDGPVGLAMFHTVFNIVNTTLLLGFVPQLARLVTRLLREKEGPVEEVAGPVHLVEGALKYPQTAIHAALKETRRLYLEPVHDAVLMGVNVSAEALDRLDDWGEAGDLAALVARSREVRTADYEEVVRTRLDPIYRALVTFSTEVHRRFTLERQEDVRLRSIGFAARDSLLILGDVSQLKRELDRFLNDENAEVRDAVDRLRVALLEFLPRARAIDLTQGRDALERDIDALE
ncbi:MAG: Na/Pi cotransporter family protein [Planctomycetota bacterium JB042]